MLMGLTLLSKVGINMQSCVGASPPRVGSAEYGATDVRHQARAQIALRIENAIHAGLARYQDHFSHARSTVTHDSLAMTAKRA
jgi:hypothetical protein